MTYTYIIIVHTLIFATLLVLGHGAFLSILCLLHDYNIIIIVNVHSRLHVSPKKFLALKLYCIIYYMIIIAKVT